MNFQTNGGQKVALTGCWKSLETPAQSTYSQIVADQCPCWRKCWNDLVLTEEDTLLTHRTVHEFLTVGWDVMKLPLWVWYSCLVLEHSVILYAKTCNTFQFIKVVRQHILGVVGNVIYYFIENLTVFAAVKEFWKSKKIWRNYRHSRVARFLRHSVYQSCPKTGSTAGWVGLRWLGWIESKFFSFQWVGLGRPCWKNFLWELY